MARRIVLYGFYSLNAQMWNVKIPHVIEDLQSSNFTGLSLHLLSPWGQHPAKPWYQYIWDGKRFVLSKKNIPWYTCLEDFLHAMFEANLDVEFCFFDQYADDAPRKIHPWTTNNLGKVMDQKPLYDSWVAQKGFVGFLHWTDKPLGNFAPIPPFGVPIMNYVTSVMDVVKKVWLAHPKSKSRFLWKRANETKGWMVWLPDKQKWHADSLRSLGDRLEIFRWMQTEWTKRGLIQSPRFQSCNDYAAWIDSDTNPSANPDDVYAATMRESFNGTKTAMRATAMEIHGVGKILNYDGAMVRKTAAWYRDVGKLPLKDLELSTDGLQMKDDFDHYTRDLYDCEDATRIDLKQEEASVPYKWTDDDMMRNWNKAFDSHAKRIS